MKSFIDHNFNLKECESEFKEFENLLDNAKNGILDERQDILPFFAQNKNLSCLIGTLNTRMSKLNKLAFEYDFWGDFACDLAIADSDKDTFCFVEFENYAHDSIFKKVGKKSTPEYSPRFEHGFSQLVDWFCRIDGFKNTSEINKKFGHNEISYLGVLIIGRDIDIADPKLKQRLNWREQNIAIASQKIYYMTFDQLRHFFKEKIENFKVMSQNP